MLDNDALWVVMITATVVSLLLWFFRGDVLDGREHWHHDCKGMNNAPIDLPEGQDCPWCGRDETGQL